MTDWKTTSRKWEKRSTKYRATILQIEADLNSGRISSALRRIQNVRAQIEADIPSPAWNPFQEPTQSQTQILESE